MCILRRHDWLSSFTSGLVAVIEPYLRVSQVDLAIAWSSKSADLLRNILYLVTCRYGF